MSNHLEIEVFNFESGQWEKRKVKEAAEILNEIDKMQQIESIGLDYRNALIEVVNQVIDIKLEKITPMRN